MTNSRYEIELNAQLVNSFGEYEDGFTRKFDYLQDAVDFINADEVGLSGSPDCSWIDNATVKDSSGVIFTGSWDEFLTWSKLVA